MEYSSINKHNFSSLFKREKEIRFSRVPTSTILKKIILTFSSGTVSVTEEEEINLTMEILDTAIRNNFVVRFPNHLREFVIHDKFLLFVLHTFFGSFFIIYSNLFVTGSILTIFTIL